MAKEGATSAALPESVRIQFSTELLITLEYFLKARVFVKNLLLVVLLVKVLFDIAESWMKSRFKRNPLNKQAQFQNVLFGRLFDLFS